MKILSTEVPSLEKFKIEWKNGTYLTDIALNVEGVQLLIQWDITQFEEFLTLLKEHLDEKLLDLAYDLVGNALYSKRR